MPVYPGALGVNRRLTLIHLGSPESLGIWLYSRNPVKCPIFMRPRVGGVLIPLGIGARRKVSHKLGKYRQPTHAPQFNPAHAPPPLPVFLDPCAKMRTGERDRIILPFLSPDEFTNGRSVVSGRCFWGESYAQNCQPQDAVENFNNSGDDPRQKTVSGSSPKSSGGREPTLSQLLTGSEK